MVFHQWAESMVYEQAHSYADMTRKDIENFGLHTCIWSKKRFPAPEMKTLCILNGHQLPYRQALTIHHRVRGRLAGASRKGTVSTTAVSAETSAAEDDEP